MDGVPLVSGDRRALPAYVCRLHTNTRSFALAAEDLENTLNLELDTGKVVIRLRPDLAPNHVERIKELAREGFYDGVVFHRVILAFMSQGGDTTGTRGGGSPKTKLETKD